MLGVVAATLGALAATLGVVAATLGAGISTRAHHARAPCAPHHARRTMRARA